MPGLVPASRVYPTCSALLCGSRARPTSGGIHAFTTSQQARRGWHSKQTWMAGINPAMTLRVNPAMTSGALHTGPFPIFLIHFSNSVSSSGVRHHPYSLRRRVRRRLFSHPRNMRGMARQVAQPLFVVAALPLESAGASRRAIAAFSLRHRAALFAGRFHFLETAMRQPAPGRRLLLATGRSPGAASDPTRMTPHESAPRRTGQIGLYSTIGLKSRDGLVTLTPGAARRCPPHSHFFHLKYTIGSIAARIISMSAKG